MELNGTIELRGADLSNEIKILESDPNAPLRLIVKLDRIKRLVTPRTDRDMVLVSSVENSKLLLSGIIKILGAMQKQESVLTKNSTDKLVSMYVFINELIDSGYQEFDSEQVKDLSHLASVVRTEVKLGIGRWYKTREFDNSDGSFSDVLDNIVITCFNNAEFLGF